MSKNFSSARLKFRSKYLTREKLEKSFVPVDGKILTNISIKNKDNEPNEEFYKWEFIYALIDAQLFNRDLIGTEIYFPKGNKNSNPIKIDAVIFSDSNWRKLYKEYRDNKNQDALSELRKLAIVMIEFKKESDKTIEQVFNSQIRATIKESDSLFTLGVYYNEGRLYLFKKDSGGTISRYDNSKNFPTSQRILEQYQLELTDPYHVIPSYDELDKKINGVNLEKSQLKIEDLDVVDRISDENLRKSLNNILRQLSEDSLFNEEGYLLLIQHIRVLKNNIKTFFRKIKLTGIILVILEWHKQLFRNFNDILLQNHLEVICINWCFIILQQNSKKKRMLNF